VIVVMSGWISVSPAGRIPSFGACGAADCAGGVSFAGEQATVRATSAPEQKRTNLDRMDLTPSM